MAFYKIEGDQLYIAQSAVYSSDYELHIQDKDTYTYPIDGWYYFDTHEEVCYNFGIEQRDINIALGIFEEIEDMNNG